MFEIPVGCLRRDIKLTVGHTSPELRRKVQVRDINGGIIIEDMVFKVTKLDEVASGGCMAEKSRKRTGHSHFPMFKGWRREEESTKKNMKRPVS